MFYAAPIYVRSEEKKTCFVMSKLHKDILSDTIHKIAVSRDHITNVCNKKLIIKHV